MIKAAHHKKISNNNKREREMFNPMSMKFMLLSLLVISIGADEELIKRECNKTDYQNICLQCLESDPASHQTDRVGLARIIIHCLDSQLNFLINNLTSKSSEIGEGEVIKEVLRDCNIGFLNVNAQLGEIDYRIAIGNYDKATRSVNTTLGYPLTCRDNLKRHKFIKLPQIYNQIGLYAQISYVAMTMIQRLESFV